MDPSPLEPLGRHGERYRSIRALGDRKGRLAAGRYAVEGDNCVRALVFSSAPVEFVVVSEPLLASGEADDLVEAAAARGIPSLRATQAAMEGLSFTDAPPGLLAVAPLRVPAPEALPEGPVAWIERAADPGNVGAALRSLAFFGFAGLLLGPGSADPWNPKALRATAGAFARTPCVPDVSPEALFRFAASRNLPAVAFDAHGGTAMSPSAGRRPALLVFGPETGGLSRAVLDKCGEIVTLTGAETAADPGVESLNLASAVAIAAFLFRRA